MRRVGMAALIAVSAASVASAATTTVPLPRPAPMRPVAAVASGTRDAQHLLIDRINAYFTNMQTLVGDFVQIGPDGRRSEGQFYIQKPGKVRFEYNPPSPIDVIADGQMVVVRNRELATQDPFPLSQTPLRLLLADRLDLSKDTNLISVANDGNSITVEIEERQLLIGTHRMKLLFAAKDLQLRQWTVTDPQGAETTILISNLDTTRKLDPSLFKISYERILQ